MSTVSKPWLQHCSCCTNACSARSIALPSAAALFNVSSYSLSGTLSATRPAPACSSQQAEQQNRSQHNPNKRAYSITLSSTPFINQIMLLDLHQQDASLWHTVLRRWQRLQADPATRMPTTLLYAPVDVLSTPFCCSCRCSCTNCLRLLLE